MTSFNINRIQKASFEANVRMPQTHLAIALFTLESSLSTSPGWDATLNIVNSVPVGDELTKRTEKANAQHRLHGIEKIISEAEIKKLSVGYIRSSLYLLHDSIVTERIVERDDTELVKSENPMPDWVTAEDMQIILELRVALNNFQDQAFFNDLLKFTREFFSSEVVLEILKRRKHIYKDWQSLDDNQKAGIEQANIMYTEQVKEMLGSEIQEYCSAANASEAQIALTNRFFWP